MNRVEQACMASGALLVVGGAAWAFAPAGVICAGILLLLASWDKA